MRMVKYIKIPADFFDWPVIKTLEARPDGDSVVLLYINLLCDAYKKSSKGVFTVANIPLTDEVMEVQFRFDDIGNKLESLEQAGLIERKERSVYVHKFWADKHDRNSVRYKDWRTAVFVRDKFTCQHCGSLDDIQAHHIKRWKENKALRYEVGNGITLCRPCHLKAHGGSWKNG